MNSSSPWEIFNTELGNVFTNYLIAFLSGFWRQARSYGRCHCRNNVIEPIITACGSLSPVNMGEACYQHIFHTNLLSSLLN